MAAALAAVAAGCAPGLPQAEEGVVKRNVAVKLMQPQPVEIRLKLPVTLRAREIIELRAPVAGTLLELPYEEGARVEASAVPAARWLELDTYLKDNPGLAVTDERVLTRNLAHLNGVRTFALVDDRALRVNFAEAQAQYDAAARTLARVAGYKDSSEQQLDSARTALVAARAQCDRLLRLIADCRVTVPAPGVLLKRLRRVGEYVNGGELVATVAVLDPLVAELHLPEAHRPAVGPGTELDIEIQSVTDALGKPAHVKARVRMVDAVAHAQTHTFRVEADIANADHALPAGVFGTTYLMVYRAENALTVPLSALRLRGESVSLFVVEGGKAREITGISLGKFSDTWAELLGDKVRPGQQVVVSGTQLIADGDEVVIRQDPTAAPAGQGARDGQP
ncbi:MAG: efflux RND transporter periplasmic adaptor subunit [Planctomycetes bacterium]|jgi:multidrug efflux system membrane fusion protein|nr:efflux RND transporter periplasmic adaptor subunit [Planctomycetota bacterium]MCL4730641.1 efflux RND transporter periplasmic adaptor subunit [Planctomycetota bacterium]